MKFELFLKKDVKLFECDDVREVKEFFETRCRMAPDGSYYYKKLNGRWERVGIATDFMEELESIGVRAAGRAYRTVCLKNGPKDGHVVHVPIKKDGSVGIPLYREYKVKRGVANYRFDLDEDCYVFDGTSEDYS